ncbi:MAG: branched-chain amino acid ABC transporter permease [Actinobacteria bacterium]|nr:MAG: branched-chain amino acid ABC transporter permease [Actinomycetota bacterium]
MSRSAAVGVLRGGAFAAAGIAFPFVVHAAWIVNIGVLTLMYAALATAWNLFSGYSGYISLGQAAFFGLGAYTLGITFAHVGIGSGYNPFYALPLVGAGVALASLPVAWIALRTRHMTFAIVTLTLLFVTQQLAFNLHSITHGSSGLMLPTPSFDIADYDRPFYLAMFALLLLGLGACWLVLRSKLGLMLLAIREDEEKARGLGIRVTTAKLIAWWLSVAVSAMVGGVWAYYLTFIYPESAVDPLVMIGAVLMTFLGGRGTLWGPAIGAFLLVPVQQYMLTRLGASQLYLVGYAAVFMVVLLVLPRGIVPSLRDWIDRVRERQRTRRGPIVREEAHA